MDYSIDDINETKFWGGGARLLMYINVYMYILAFSCSGYTLIYIIKHNELIYILKRLCCTYKVSKVRL